MKRTHLFSRVMAAMRGDDLPAQASMFAAVKSGDTLMLDMYGYVGDWWEGNTAEEFKSQLNRAGAVSNIHMDVHSLGGFLQDGLPIHNMLLEHPAKVTATVQGYAASMMSAILMAADHIRAHEATWVMIHEVHGGVFGSAEDMEREAQWVRKTNEMAANIYAKRSGQSLEKIQEMMKVETWLTGTEAKELGFVDELITIEQARADVSEGMQTALGSSMSFTALDHYANMPSECFSAQQRARLSAQPKPNGETDVKITQEQLTAAQGVVATASAAPNQEAIDAANTIIEQAKIEGLVTDTPTAGSEKPNLENGAQPGAEMSGKDAAEEIAQLCQLAGKPEKIAGYLSDGKTPVEVRAELSAQTSAQRDANQMHGHFNQGGDGGGEKTSMADVATSLVKRQGGEPRT